MSRYNSSGVLAIALAVACGCGCESKMGMRGDGLDVKKSDMAGVPTYQVTITNLTKGQVFSPPLFVTQAADAHVWQDGRPASPAVQQVAETGDVGNLAEMLKATATDVVMVPDAIKPGESKTITIQGKNGDGLSSINMLVLTNDGFTGVDAIPLKAGTYDVMAYDAGTEQNTERAADVPGAPFLGTHETPTEPHEPIHVHPGIKGVGDLTPDMGWSGPVARVVVVPK